MDTMRAFLTEKGMARQYWPERLELLPELPRTASGKIGKVELREMLGGAGHHRERRRDRLGHPLGATGPGWP